ncbi:MAG: ATP-dependent DNA helicase, partial [Paracholeplasma sp.]
QDIFMNETILTKEVIEEYARKHMVCPFEFSLYVSYFVDVIVCDYNYVFDPRVHLIRYFDDETYQPIVLVDEAHNLINRSRDMYSAKLSKEDLIDLRKKGSKLKPSIRNQVNKVIEYFDTLDEKLAEAHLLSIDLPDYTLSEKVTFLMKKIQSSLKENQDYPKKSEVMEGYLKLLNYSVIMEYYNQAYKTNVMRQGDDLVVSLSCLDASEYLKQTINNKIQSAVFFSATLSPLDYYKTLINQNEGYDLTIASPFDPSRLKVIVMDQINTRFQHREASLDVIVEVIKKVVAQKKGNYIVFFPSYQYLNAVKKVLPKSLDALIIVQERDMNVQSRDETLLKFRADSPISQLGFFVMGGVFSEGIDYVGNMLNGVIIVGVGMPMLNHENDQLKSYYDLTFQKGFDYAYTYPGMNKVIQAVGRVIRRDDDYGIAILIDDRFSKSVYRKLMPSHWTNQQVCKTPEALEMVLSDFWLEMEKKKD